MGSVVTSNFRLYNAEKFLEAFSSSTPPSFYLTIGKSTSWTDDFSPPLPVNSVKTSYSYWREIIAMKKVLSSDVSYVTNKYVWTSNTVYDAYTDQESLDGKKYFVVNEHYDVYKCIHNAYGTASIVGPSGQSNTTFTTPDGYIWKYMYSIPSAKALKFISSGYMAIQTLTSDDASFQWDVQQSAANGSIAHVQVTNGGSGYVTHAGILQSANSTTATIAASANGFNGVYNQSAIYIASGPGAGQVRQITNYTGATKLVQLSSAWATVPTDASVYIVSPRVSLAKTGGEGSGFLAYSTVAAGAVSKVTVVSPGLNYANAEVVFTANAGSGAVASPMLSPQGGHGKDATTELLGYNVMLDVKLSGNEGGSFTTDNEYRQIGLIVNPRLISNNAIATDSSFDLTTRVNLSSIVGTFIKDDLVTGAESGATGRIVDFVSGRLRLVDVVGTFENGELLNGPAAYGTITSIEYSLIKPYSGQLLYLEQRTPIARDAQQQETYKVTIVF